MAPTDRDAVEQALDDRLADRDQVAALLLDCEARTSFGWLRLEADAAAGGRCARALGEWDRLWALFRSWDARLREIAALRDGKGRLGRAADVAEAMLNGHFIDPDPEPELRGRGDAPRPAPHEAGGREGSADPTGSAASAHSAGPPDPPDSSGSAGGPGSNPSAGGAPRPGADSAAGSADAAGSAGGAGGRGSNPAAGGVPHLGVDSASGVGGSRAGGDSASGGPGANWSGADSADVHLGAFGFALRPELGAPPGFGVGRPGGGEPTGTRLRHDGVLAVLADRFRTVSDLLDEIEAAFAQAALDGTDPLVSRLDALEAQESQALARWAETRARISDPRVPRPRTAAGSLRGRLADIPALGEPGWTETTRVRKRLSRNIDAAERRVADALAACNEPLHHRNRLRSEAEAYRARADRLGLASDPRFRTAWERARTVLWTAPCSLPEARKAVDALAASVNGDRP
ncbi:hypothetical protein SAMN05216298_2997 [Glycomyces sambucus]|uniref:Uncharacterized protein n=1 Tax=Glycomyces sambucus TaxID=380244 RepID=A0A1G9I2Q4_9ACTN|nr:hypothetical protein SAMN05216298_2997 [Glycomyces sambucus]